LLSQKTSMGEREGIYGMITRERKMPSSWR
jgi:hypothetical protein